jgi:hypothetical protein
MLQRGFFGIDQNTTKYEGGVGTLARVDIAHPVGIMRDPSRLWRRWW